MQRITISIEEGLGAAFDAMIEARGYRSRSEGVRDLVRQAVEDWRQTGQVSESCVANLSFVYDQNVRSLASWLSEWRHDHHDLIITSTLVPLDHRNTLESLMLRGGAIEVRALADGIRAERGVHFGTLNLIGVETGDAHQGADHHHHTGHRHLSPKIG